MGWGILQVSDAMYSEPLDVPDDGVIGGAGLVWSAPNPFSPGTVLTYHVPSTSHVRLRVYDIAGRHVRTLFDSRQEAGTFTAHWDGRDNRGANVASGVYFCRYERGGETETAKLALVR
jgi:hypothetical protein